MSVSVPYRTVGKEGLVGKTAVKLYPFVDTPCVLKDTSGSLFKRVLRLRGKNFLLNPRVVELNADPSGWHPTCLVKQITINNFTVGRIRRSDKRIEKVVI